MVDEEWQNLPSGDAHRFAFFKCQVDEQAKAVFLVDNSFLHKRMSGIVGHKLQVFENTSAYHAVSPFY